MADSLDHAGKNAMYRWYLADPIHFERSLVWTIEHGHDNDYENDYASVAYWYEAEPHLAHPPLPGMLGRLPRFPDGMLEADDARGRAQERWREMRSGGVSPERVRELRQILDSGCAALMEWRVADARAAFETVLEG